MQFFLYLTMLAVWIYGMLMSLIQLVQTDLSQQLLGVSA